MIQADNIEYGFSAEIFYTINIFFSLYKIQTQILLNYFNFLGQFLTSIAYLLIFSILGFGEISALASHKTPSYKK